jgi:hypothetical protein
VRRYRVPELDGLALIITDKPDPERDAVAAAWMAGGGDVVRVARFWEPPPVAAQRVRVYGNDTFCLVLAQRLGLDLVSPPDDLLLRLDPTLLRRELRGVRLDEVHDLEYPAFAKSAAPKLFPAEVYTSVDELRDAAQGLEPDTLVLVSETVFFDGEVRCWILDGQVVTAATYEGDVDLGEASAFAVEVARHPAVPPVCVLDVGLIHNRGWAVIEANAAWGSGLNGCDPAAAVRCIARATRLA